MKTEQTMMHEVALARLLQDLGEDSEREGLQETPKRWVRAMREMTAGYQVDPGGVLAKVFDEDSDELVVLRGIHFASLCEHHLMPFTGTAAVGYLPHGRVVGISKLARLVECFARRLQVQERMTRQIAEALEQHLRPRGVGVLVVAEHGCMRCRGVRSTTSELVTSCLLGVLRNHARDEFLALARGGWKP